MNWSSGGSTVGSSGRREGEREGGGEGGEGKEGEREYYAYRSFAGGVSVGMVNTHGRHLGIQCVGVVHRHKYREHVHRLFAVNQNKCST